MGGLVQEVEQAEPLWQVVAVEVVAKVRKPDRILKSVQIRFKNVHLPHLDENCVILGSHDLAPIFSLQKQIVLNRAPQLRYFINRSI